MELQSISRLMAWMIFSTSVVYRYSDSNGTKYMIHEVTDGKGNVIHRDFDAVRIPSGQIINKGH